jgi:hypothetical protein
MTENHSLESYKVSPSQGPFRFHAWLELPFPLSVEINETFPVEYRPDVTVELQVVTESNAFKVVTGNRWQHGREVREMVSRVQSGERLSLPRGWRHEYVSEGQVLSLVNELEQSEHTRYVHVEKVPTVVSISSPLPESIIPNDDFVPYDLGPSMGFFRKEVLPRLQIIVSAYRIAARPWMRYCIQPISEALIDNATIYFTDGEGRSLGRIHYGFDHRSSPLQLATTAPDIQSRFDLILASLSDLQAESQMATAYYLYHMRRWTEAVAVASSVVESLLRELVFQVASTEVEAEVIWRACRYKELFNKILPKFGKPKLSETQQSLWANFIKAKEYRGAKVHGSYANPFDSAQEEAVRDYLNAFYGVAQWISQQLGRSWVLDFPGQNQEPFP